MVCKRSSVGDGLLQRRCQLSPAPPPTALCAVMLMCIIRGGCSNFLCKDSDKILITQIISLEKLSGRAKKAESTLGETR